MEQKPPLGERSYDRRESCVAPQAGHVADSRNPQAGLDFWASTSLGELAAAQGIGIAESVETL